MHEHHLPLAFAALAPVACPTCAEPAAVVDRLDLAGTGGAVAHIKVRCAAGHWYTLPADRVRAYDVRLGDVAA